jgi:hypothetical protein
MQIRSSPRRKCFEESQLDELNFLETRQSRKASTKESNASILKTVKETPSCCKQSKGTAEELQEKTAPVKSTSKPPLVRTEDELFMISDDKKYLVS